VGTSEIILNGVNGIVIYRTQPEEIAKQIEMLMDDSKLRRKLGKNAYQYIKNNLSWERYAKNVENVFEQAISRPKKLIASISQCLERQTSRSLLNYSVNRFDG
jgi:glycosyltransferase involved in cell wall biosynthesis